MCGRYALDAETDELIQEFVAAGGDFRDWRPAYSIAPTNRAPIIRQHPDNGRVIDAARWGFKPSWAKDNGPAPINARLETVATNGMFRSAFTSQRALVPMRGYYEWEQRDDGKQPYFIHANELLAAAGLYTARKYKDDWVLTFTIITREARDASGEIHDRMPVFLTPDVWDYWLSTDKITDKDAALTTLDGSSTAIASTITTYPVGREVNNVRTLDREDPSLITPIDN